MIFLQYYGMLVSVAQQEVEKEQQRLSFLLWKEQCQCFTTFKNKLEKPTTRETGLIFYFYFYRKQISLRIENGTKQCTRCPQEQERELRITSASQMKTAVHQQRSKRHK